jgi:hypothetical protein
MVRMHTKSSNLNYSIAADYSYCDLCALNGHPNQKVVFEYEGLRPEDQDGFIYKFSVYEYPLLEHLKRRHVHVFQSKQVVNSKHKRAMLQNDN